MKKGGKTLADLLWRPMAGCMLLLHVMNKVRQTCFPPPTNAELSAIPFIWLENIGLTLQLSCVSQKKNRTNLPHHCAL